MNFKLPPRTIEWIGDLDGTVRLIDQTLLPGELALLDIENAESMYEAIKSLRVRGAPAIGIAAAMGAVLGVRDFNASNGQELSQRLEEVCDYLASSRPTAVNLTWALNRLRLQCKTIVAQSPDTIKLKLLNESKRIRDEDAAMCRAIGEHGQHLIDADSGVLTHCNAGSLATAEYGTALAPMYVAHKSGRSFRVFANETRPLLQGARLTAWELMHAGVDVTLLCDGMAASLMSEGKVDLVITGADRIAANGDVANKIGTLGVALLAQAFKIPFYVAAPSTTFDLSVPDGSHIPIEIRDSFEIRAGFGRPTAPTNVNCYTPAFDITPARLIAGLITERGLIDPVNVQGIQAMIDPKVTCQDISKE